MYLRRIFLCIFSCVFFTLFAFNANGVGYVCEETQYTSCNSGYYMTYNGVADSKPKAGNDCTVCPDGAMCSGGTVAPVYSCSSGDYYNGSECVSCDKNYYCPGDYEGKKLCPTAYALADGRAAGEKDCYLVLNPGTYVATPHGGQTTCPAGSYCPGNSRVYYNDTGGSKTCPSNSTSGTGASSCTCNTGYNYNGGKTTTSNACVGNTYTIVYDKNGGSGTMSNTACTYGSNCTLRTNAFTKTGHTFAGWSYNGATYSDATSVNILLTTNGATITFTAQWTPETYTLTLDRNGATSGDTSATTQYGAGGFCSAGSKTDTTCLMNIYTPYRTGYKFNGYFTEKTGGTMWIDANGYPVTPTTITSSRTLYAQWTPKTYTLTLDRNGATDGDTSATTQYGANGFCDIYGYYCELSILKPHRPGYTFNGYFTEQTGGTMWINANGYPVTPTTITSSRTLYAQWTPEIYTLTLDRNGATSGDTSATTQYEASGFCSTGSKTDTTCSLNVYTPYRTGYIFNGYFTEKTGGTMWIDANGYPVTPTTITSSRTLYAQWTANSYTCSAGTYLSKTVCEQCPAGYYCPGGTRTYDGVDHMKYACPSNSTSGAGASECTCNTGYNYNGDTTTSSNPCVANTYTLTYSANNGSGTMDDKICTYGQDCIVDGNKFTRDGYTFNGWTCYGDICNGGMPISTSENFKNRVTTNNVKIQIAAQWKKNIYTCAAGEYLSGTSCTTCPTGSYCPGVTDQEYTGGDIGVITCPANSTSGAGASSCTCNAGYNYNGGTTTTSNVCVGNTYTIVYDNNGGSGTMSNTTCTYGSNCTLRTNVFTKTGHTFAGWSYNGTEYSDGTSVNILPTTNGAAMTFVAQWSTNALTCSPGEYLDDVTCRQCESDSYCTGGTWNYDGGVHGITKCPGVTDKLGAFDVMFVNTAAQTSVEQCRASFMFAEKWQLSELLGGTDIVPDVNYDEKLNKRGFFFVNCDYDLKSGEYDANCTGVAVLCGAGYVSQFTDSPLENGNFRDFLYHATSPQDAIENTCISVGDGYWSPGADSCAGMPFDSEKIQCMNRALIGRNQCPTGLRTIGYGLGADEAGDCGRILHVGDDKVYLRSDKKTKHALRVRVDDTVYYSNMSESDINMNVESERKLRVLYNGVQYCVYDDSVL